MKRSFIILGSLVLIIGAFVLIGVLNQIENNQLESKNPYDKPVSELHPETVKLFSNSDYDHIILPDDLAKKIEDKEDVVIYFFSPTCPHCRVATPLLQTAASDLGITIEKLNLLEYLNTAAAYKVTSTPTLIVFKDGEEVERLVGQKTEKEFYDWLAEHAQ